jgi:4-carboxymuconolactone decarboxylase
MGKVENGTISFDIEARERHVLGTGPRIAAIPNDEVDEESWKLVRAIRATTGAGPIEVMPEYMRIALKHPGIFRCQMEMGTVLFQGTIDPRERELAVLRCGWLCRAPYEWGEHVAIGKRYGISDEEIERVTQGSSAHGWSAHDAAILRGVEELIADQALSDETWNALAKTWNEQQLFEFPMMVGQYVATAFVQNTVRIALSDTNPGLASR